MSILIISSSLSADSRSRMLALSAHQYAGKAGYDVEFVDLRDFPLPVCDGGDSFSDVNALKLSAKISAASAIILAGPVYSYSYGASAKNLVDMTGAAWKTKPVGLIVSGGGKGSYMSALSLANSLMLDHRCPIVPKYVYADSTGFAEEGIVEDLLGRIRELVDTVKHWGEVL